MLTEQEKLNVTDLLNTLPTTDLMYIAKTTTSGIISPNNAQEAIQIILQHLDDVRTLLGRKKITKTVLFKYLHCRKVPFKANIDKALLVEATIEYWQKTNVAIASTSQSNNAAPSSHQSVSSVTDELSLKFTEWYFAKVNEKLSPTGGETITTQDFWDDAVMIVNLHNGSDRVIHTAESSEQVVALLESLQQQHGLLFSPNLSMNGVRGKSEPHGMVLVRACGTLHQGQGQCVGIFEQAFGLIKDPYVNDNWRIKKTEITLRSQLGVTTPPMLT